MSFSINDIDFTSVAYEDYRAESEAFGNKWFPGADGLDGEVEIGVALDADGNPTLATFSVEKNSFGAYNHGVEGVFHFDRESWLAVRAEVDRILGTS
jgi:hypothetical protein